MLTLGLSCSPWGHVEAHPELVQVYNGAAVEVCLGAVEAHPGALETHPGALVSAMEAHPGALESCMLT
jgi:hypothetical protein